MGAPQQIAQYEEMQPQRGARRADVAERPSQVVSPWLTTEQVADYLQYTGVARLRSVYRFLKTNGIPVRRRGAGARTILVARRDLDRAIEGR